MATACLLGMALFSLWPSLGSSATSLPALPQAFIDTTYSLPAGGNTINVNAGGNFQAALNGANLGDVIVLQAGATFTGNFTLPVKTKGSGWIYVVSSNYSSLPSPGNRAVPTDAPNMAKLVFPYGNSGIGIQAASGANHYRFIGIEMAPVQGVFMYTLFAVGNGETSAAALPSNITIDRCYIHGDPTLGGRRGVEMDGINVAVIDSYVSGFMQVGSDTQAVWAYNSPGPFKISNNYLEASSENILFGGADPAIANSVPSDITITGNYIAKQIAWMSVTPAWQVKNLIELKNAQRVLIQGNLLQNNWPSAQDGYSVLFTPRNQNGNAPWSVVQDITFQLNTLTNVSSGINIMGHDSPNTSQNTYRILIKNNIIGVAGLGGGGKIFQILSGVNNLTIDHNTAFITTTTGSTELGSMDGTPANDQFVFSNNLVTHGAYGFFGSNQGEGNGCLKYYFTNWLFTNNAIIGPNMSSTYPANNYFPANVTAVGFVNYSGGDYHLSTTSPYKSAGTDGLDLGANIDAIASISTGVAGPGAFAPPKNLQVVH